MHITSETQQYFSSDYETIGVTGRPLNKTIGLGAYPEAPTDDCRFHHGRAWNLGASFESRSRESRSMESWSPKPEMGTKNERRGSFAGWFFFIFERASWILHIGLVLLHLCHHLTGRGGAPVGGAFAILPSKESDQLRPQSLINSEGY